MGSSSSKKGSSQQPQQAKSVPKLVNNQIPEGLRGDAGGAWTPAQTQAGGRWEVPAGAPAGAIGRNWVPAGGGRSQLAQAMSQRNLPGRWVDRLGYDPTRITHGGGVGGSGDQGGQHASGGNAFGWGDAAGRAGASIGRSLGKWG